MIFREAERYHQEFPSPMAVVNDDTHVFVNDFVIFYHETFGKTIGKVIKFFKKDMYHAALSSFIIRNWMCYLLM